ncbi:MAG TPA: hypothetical protein VEU62_02825 [Bryobacterales bacterium]|nr:hypothetical protein [Bryobacterales bacterium]
MNRNSSLAPTAALLLAAKAIPSRDREGAVPGFVPPKCRSRSALRAASPSPGLPCAPARFLKEKES